MQTTLLSIIIVTWNGLKHLPRCLGCLLPQLPPAAEIILVDNGSKDGTPEWVQRHHPDVRLIELGRNAGFAGGVDAGVRRATGELILLINDDAFIEPGFVGALVGTMTDQPSLGAAGAVLLFDHRPELVASAGICVYRNGVALDLWAGRAVTDLPTASCEIVGPSGGAALYRRSMLVDVGGFEASFFAYLEDVDLAWRMRLRGWRTLLVPQARARHVYSATGGQGSPLKQRLLARNRVRAIIRCLPLSLLLRALPWILAYDVLAAVYGVLKHHPAMIAGRLEALAELPRLLRQRRLIQARRTAHTRELARWFEPALLPWVSLRMARQLDAILRERSM